MAYVMSIVFLSHVDRLHVACRIQGSRAMPLQASDYGPAGGGLYASGVRGRGGTLRAL